MSLEPALLDPLGRQHTYLRLSITDRCNFRCTYCKPPEGSPLSRRAEILSIEELLRISRLFVRLGVTKIRVTGGEPLVRRGVDELLLQLGQLEGLQELCLTTNGTLLEEHLPAMQAARVSQVNISLDSLRADRFARITLRDELPATLRGLEAALKAGFKAVKLNCVLMRGVNDDELEAFAELGRDAPLSVRFIEYMPLNGRGFELERVVPVHEMRERLGERYALVPLGREGGSGTADRYQIEGFVGSVGFISAMGDHFCGACNRLRVTADGHLKVCLFGKGELNLRDPLRAEASEEVLADLIRGALGGKLPRLGGHSPASLAARDAGRTMGRIGG